MCGLQLFMEECLNLKSVCVICKSIIFNLQYDSPQTNYIWSNEQQLWRSQTIQDFCCLRGKGETCNGILRYTLKFVTVQEFENIEEIHLTKETRLGIASSVKCVNYQSTITKEYFVNTTRLLWRDTSALNLKWVCWLVVRTPQFQRQHEEYL